MIVQMRRQLVERGELDPLLQSTLDAVANKFIAHDIDVTLIGLNVHSAELHDRMTGHLASSH